MSVSIIGTRGCGKSTFIGLLHQGMEMYTNKNPNNFIYYVTAEVGDKILDIRNNLLQGQYPAATTRHQLEQLRFLMGFKPRASEKMVQLVRNFSSFGAYGDYLGMILSVYDIAGEDIQEFKINKQVNQILKQVFDSNILVIIIDCAKFTNSTKGRKYVDMLEYDKELAVILAAIHHQSETVLFHVAPTSYSTRLFPSATQGRHENPHQQRDNGNDDEKLDQGESSSLPGHRCSSWCPTGCLTLPEAIPDITPS